MRLFTAEATVLAMAVLVAGMPGRASAQERAERIRFGPLGVKPIFRTSVTHDDNLFLDPVNPTADIATTFSPEVRASLIMGRMRLLASNASSFVHYRKSREEPSANTTNAVRLEAALTRFKPFVSYGFTNVRDRPNQEIDARVRHQVAVAGAGTQIQLAHRTSIGVDIQRSSTRFEDDAQFLGTSLSRSLDRTSTIGTAAVRYELTPLTRLLVIVGCPAGLLRVQRASVHDNTGDAAGLWSLRRPRSCVALQSSATVRWIPTTPRFPTSTDWWRRLIWDTYFADVHGSACVRTVTSSIRSVKSCHITYKRVSR